MPELIILGSSNAIPSPGHANTHLALITPERRLLIDCGPNPVISLAQAGVDVNSLTDIIVTHFHPDHVASLPLLLMDMWLMGRRQPLNIHGLDYTIDRITAMLELYDWLKWPNFYPVHFLRVPMTDRAVVLEDEQVRIYSSPVKHLLPNICLRVELKTDGTSLAYSSDTEPCPAVADIARDVDFLLHEATGATTGHSSAAQAGEIAHLAGARALYLIHYPTGRFAGGDILAEAGTQFAGQIVKAVDLMKIDLSSTRAETGITTPR